MPRTVSAAFAAAVIVWSVPSLAQQYFGSPSISPYSPNVLSNPNGAGSPDNPSSLTNPHGPYGSPYSIQSATNPYATNAPTLHNSRGNDQDRLSANPNEPDSASNPQGQFGRPYSPKSFNNPYGAGNPYSYDGPANSFGQGTSVFGQ
ncbi:MAG: hypothetical protein WAN51_13785 [Alphaproteobacteria bacterium]